MDLRTHSLNSVIDEVHIITKKRLGGNRPKIILVMSQESLLDPFLAGRTMVIFVHIPSNCKMPRSNC